MKYDTETFTADEEALRGVAGLRSPEHRTLDPEMVTADQDGRKSLDACFWVASSGDKGRPLPRTRAKAKISTTDTVLPVDSAQSFVAGDVLRIVPASAQINLSGTWASGNTLTIEVAGADFVYTATGSDIAVIADEAAAAFNADPQFMYLATAIAGEESVHILAKDFSSAHSIAVSATGGTAAIANNQTVLLAFREIGTVDTNGVNVSENQLTLTGTAAFSAPIGMPIGTADTPIGLHLRPLDLLEQAVEVGLHTSASIKKGVMPYYDDGLAKLFPEIQVG